MRRSRLIVLVIALAAGAIAAMLASGNRTPAPPPPAPPPPPLATTDVLVAKTDLNTGQVVNEGDIGWATGGGFMAAVLPQGMRAVAIDITPESDAGGFILPNDHVDVILTRRDKWAEKVGGVEKYISETILRNV